MRAECMQTVAGRAQPVVQSMNGTAQETIVVSHWRIGRLVMRLQFHDARNGPSSLIVGRLRSICLSMHVEPGHAVQEGGPDQAAPARVFKSDMTLGRRQSYK